MTITGKKGYVYVLSSFGNDGTYKIGATRGEISNRIKELQTGNSDEIFEVKHHETNFPFFIERKLHKKFENRNVLNEWYELPKEDVDNFEKYCQEQEKLIEILKNNPFFAKELR